MKALLVIDMQDAYFKDPALIRQKDSLVRNINQLIETFQSSEDLIINVKTVHSPDKSTWTLNMREDDKGFAFEKDDETRTVSELEVDQAVEITKDRDSCFHETTLQDLLKEHNVTELTLCGILSHTCVFQTAVDAYAYNYPVTIVRDAVGDVDKTLEAQAFDYLMTEYRQNIT